MLNITKLYDLTAVGIKDVAMRMLGSAQRERPEAIVAGIAALLILICRRYSVDCRRVLEVTERIQKDMRDLHPTEYRAMVRLIAEELPDA
jgi:hypothetical protein